MMKTGGLASALLLGILATGCSVLLAFSLYVVRPPALNVPDRQSVERAAQEKRSLIDALKHEEDRDRELRQFVEERRHMGLWKQFLLDRSYLASWALVWIPWIGVGLVLRRQSCLSIAIATTPLFLSCYGGAIVLGDLLSCLAVLAIAVLSVARLQTGPAS
jgi:hypothetical protein